MSNTFKVIRRDNRRKADSLLDDILLVINDPEVKVLDCFCFPIDPFLIHDAMTAVEICFHQMVGVKSIGFEISLDDTPVTVAYSFMKMLLAEIGQDYYVLGSVKNIEAGKCLITLLMQSVSYRNGNKYLDNNANLVKFVGFLESITNTCFEIKVGTFFSGTSEDSSCYV